MARAIKIFIGVLFLIGSIAIILIPEVQDQGENAGAVKSENMGINFREPQSALVLDFSREQDEKISIWNTLNTQTRNFFDVDDNQYVELVQWVGQESLFLARDLNGNGEIDSRRELFHSGKDGTGYEMLARFDKKAEGGNGDGVIDAQDKIWQQLVLWQKPDAGLIPLSKAKLKAIPLKYNARSVARPNHEHVVGSSGKWIGEKDGRGGYVHEVYFKVDYANTWYQGADAKKLPDVSREALQMPLSRGYGRLKPLHIALTANPELMKQMMGFVNTDSEYCESFNQTVYEMLFRWAEVPRSNTATYDDMPEREMLQFLAAFLAADLRDIQLRERTTGQAKTHWNTVHTLMKQRFLVQGPLQDVFAGSYYDFEKDSLVLAGGLDGILDRAKLLAPFSEARQCHWRNVEDILAVHAPAFNLKEEQMRQYVAVKSWESAQ